MLMDAVSAGGTDDGSTDTPYGSSEGCSGLDSREKRKAQSRPGLSNGNNATVPNTHKKERNHWTAGETARPSSIFLDRNNLEPAKELLSAIMRDPQLILDPDLKFVKNFMTHFGFDYVVAEDASDYGVDAVPEDSGEVESQRDSDRGYEYEYECEEDDYFEEGIDDKLLPPENDPMPPAGRDPELEPSDQDFEQAAEHRVSARQASARGEWSLAVDELTAALQLSPSSLLYAQRATVLLSASRPLAALRDCDTALSMNPESATSRKTRGAVYRRLGDWQAAHEDLSLGLSMDYDHESAVLFKECAQHHERAMVRRREREQRQANQRAAQPMREFKDDPDMVRAASNPRVMEAVQAISENPSLAAKYISDPDIGPVVLKLMGHMAAKQARSPHSGGVYMNL